VAKQGKTTDNVFAFIRRFQERQGLSPSLQDIGDALNLSGPTVLYHLRRLEQVGLIERIAGASRGIRLT